jgi:predicted PurR-regulated permease PerM
VTATTNPIPEVPPTETGDTWERHWPPLTYWAKVVVTVIATIWVMFAVRTVATILLLVVISLVLAVGAEPPVAWLTGKGLRRGHAVLAVLATVLVAIAAFLAILIPAAAQHIGSLSTDLPAYLSQLQARGGWVGEFLQRTHAVAQVQTFLQKPPAEFGASVSVVLGIAGRVGAALLAFGTIIVLTVYFMLSLPGLRARAPMVFRPEIRERVEPVIEQSLTRIGGYVAGNGVTSVVCAMVTSVALLLMGIPFAVPLAIWAGFADLIPVVGSYAGAIPAIVVGLFVSPLTGALVAVYFVVYQQFENYFLVPRVMRGAVDLSPASVIVATLVGASLGGFVGALLALPIAATIKVVVIEIWLRDRVEEGDELARRHLRGIRRRASAERVDAEKTAKRRALWFKRLLSFRSSAPTPRETASKD